MKLISIEVVPNSKMKFTDGNVAYTLDLIFQGWFTTKRVLMTPTGMANVNKETDVIRYFCFVDELGNGASSDLNIQLTNFCRTYEDGGKSDE